MVRLVGWRKRKGFWYCFYAFAAREDVLGAEAGERTGGWGGG